MLWNRALNETQCRERLRRFGRNIIVLRNYTIGSDWVADTVLFSEAGAMISHRAYLVR